LKQGFFARDFVCQLLGNGLAKRANPRCQYD
jgi:hypothetical protein